MGKKKNSGKIAGLRVVIGLEKGDSVDMPLGLRELYRQALVREAQNSEGCILIANCHAAPFSESHPFIKEIEEASAAMNRKIHVYDSLALEEVFYEANHFPRLIQLVKGLNVDIVVMDMKLARQLQKHFAGLESYHHVYFYFPDELATYDQVNVRVGVIDYIDGYASRKRVGCRLSKFLNHYDEKEYEIDFSVFHQRDRKKLEKDLTFLYVEHGQEKQKKAYIRLIKGKVLTAKDIESIEIEADKMFKKLKWD